MRVLIFSTAYLPLIGGAELAVKEIADRLPDIEFVMITSRLRGDLAEHEKIGNVSVHRIGKGNALDKFRLIWHGWVKAQSLGVFNVVWAIMASHGGFAALRYKKRNRSVPFLLTLQEGDSKWHIYKHVWWCWPYFKQIFKTADRIQAISNYLARWSKEMGAVCPVDVVPNGVVIRAGKKSDEVKRVITVSRLVEKNGLENLIKAIKEVNRSYPQPVVLKIIGDGELENKLRKLAKSLGLDDCVAIFEGSLPNQEVYQRLSQADVFVRSSLSEGLGTAFLEAMAMGVPIIGTRVGGIPDFLTDGETGLFCDNDPMDIAKKIKMILDDSTLAERLRTNAQKLISEKYTWDIVARQMNKVFESAL